MQPWDSHHSSSRDLGDSKVDFAQLNKISKLTGAKRKKLLKKIPKTVWKKNIPTITDLSDVHIKLGGGLNRLSAFCQEDPIAAEREQLIRNEKLRQLRKHQTLMK